MKLAEYSGLIPVYREIVADMETPVSVYGKVFKEGYSCLLESVEGSDRLARYSFIAGDPFLVLKAYGERLEISAGGKTEVKKGNLVKVLRKIMAGYKWTPAGDLPRFCGGAVGYIGYDTVSHFEAIPGSPRDDLELPDTFLIFPESIIAFDHYKSRLKIIVNAMVEEDPAASYQKAVRRIDELLESIRDTNCPYRRNNDKAGLLTRGALQVESNVAREEFLEKVEKIKGHIFAGDVLQVVLSQRFVAEIKVDPLQVYRALRTLNPSPYMYYFNFGRVKVAGASPEMLVRLEDGIVENRPIAGTRPRGETAERDRQYEEELQQDEKEKAEHVMLVDLGRNDLGRVCQYGSVEVPAFMRCERYSHVMHLVSEVKGKLREGMDALDAFKASFPAGTVSGAPKVRAMEIIDHLETTKRGPYAGAAGYFSFTGDMDTCIIIRTAVIVNDRLYAQAGAGIVAGSRPEREYEETVSKARVLLEALKMAEEGLG